MRVILALVAIAMIVPGAASAQDRRHWQGLWQGNVGDQPVHVCLQWDDRRSSGDIEGLYYFDSAPTPVRLEVRDGALRELAAGGGPSAPLWQLANAAGGLTGSRTEGEHSLPVRLEPLAWLNAGGAAEAVPPCMAPAFHAPRFAGGAWVEEAGTVDGHALFTTTYLPPAALGAAAADGYPKVVLQGLRLVERQAGDGAINAALADQVREETARDCLASSLAFLGTDGDWSVSILPEVVTDRWLGVSVASGNFCGGAHPNFGEAQQVYDRHSGARVYPEDWFSSAAFATQWLDPEVAGEQRIALHTITPAFQDLIVRHWEMEVDPDTVDCRDAVANGFGWNIGLAPGGLTFLPELPHVAQYCAWAVTVPWAELEPFLTAEGQAVRAGL